MLDKEVLVDLLGDKKVRVYLMVNLYLMLINITSSSSHLWFLYPLLIWGFFLLPKKYLKYSTKRQKCKKI